MTPDSLAVETIVVGIADLSASGEAFARAVVRSMSTPFRLHLVHSYRDLANVWLSVDALAAVEPLRQDCDSQLAAMAASLETEAGPVGYDSRPGSPATVLASVAREQGADLIAVGTSGRRGWAWGLGGIVRRLSRCAPCPLLVVPAVPAAVVANGDGHASGLSEVSGFPPPAWPIGRAELTSAQ